MMVRSTFLNGILRWAVGAQLVLLLLTATTPLAKAQNSHELDGCWKLVQYKFRSTRDKKNVEVMQIYGGRVTESTYDKKLERHTWFSWYNQRLNPNANPKAVDRFNYGAPPGKVTYYGVTVMRGIYRLDGNRLVIEMNRHSPTLVKPEGSRRPWRFTRNASDDLGEKIAITRYVWERVPGVNIIGLYGDASTSTVVVHNASNRTEVATVRIFTPTGVTLNSSSHTKRVTVGPWKSAKLTWRYRSSQNTKLHDIRAKLIR